MDELKVRHCERRRREIAMERLLVLPETGMCVECVKAVGGEFYLGMTPGWGIACFGVCGP